MELSELASYYQDMLEYLHPEKKGEAELTEYEITENDYRAIIRDKIPIGKYIRLRVNNTLMMSNTPMEMATNLEFLLKAHGKVLIGGLGIGLIILPLLDNENIGHITVIEKSQDVIDLVNRQLNLPPEKVTIVCGDVFKNPQTEKFNTIYMDIWSAINRDVFEDEMIPLMAAYEQYLDPEDSESFFDCWCMKEAEHELPLTTTLDVLISDGKFDDYWDE